MIVERTTFGKLDKSKKKKKRMDGWDWLVEHTSSSSNAGRAAVRADVPFTVVDFPGE
jgi:hypothetical protein